MPLIPYFLAAWVVGITLLIVAYRRTSRFAHFPRALILSLIAAIAFTPADTGHTPYPAVMLIDFSGQSGLQFYIFGWMMFVTVLLTWLGYAFFLAREESRLRPTKPVEPTVVDGPPIAGSPTPRSELESSTHF